MTEVYPNEIIVDYTIVGSIKTALPLWEPVVLKVGLPCISFSVIRKLSLSAHKLSTNVFSKNMKYSISCQIVEVDKYLRQIRKFSNLGRIVKSAKILCLCKDLQPYFMPLRGLISLGRGKLDMDYILIIGSSMKKIEEEKPVLSSRKFKGNTPFPFHSRRWIDIFIFTSDNKYHWLTFKWIFTLFNNVLNMKVIAFCLFSEVFLSVNYVPSTVLQIMMHQWATHKSPLFKSLYFSSLQWLESTSKEQ